MGQIAQTLGLILASYALGSVPFSFLVAKAKGVDLRKVGSGNIGGSNVWRSCGFGAFVVAASCDILKGMIPTLLGLRWLAVSPLVVVLVGLAAILGHTFPIFLNFKGGKAVATSGGVVLAIAPLLLGFGVLMWAIVFAVSRIASVASMSAAVLVALAGTVLLVRGVLELPYVAFIWLACALIIYLHRENIQRLMAGTENKFTRIS